MTRLLTALAFSVFLLASCSNENAKENSDSVTTNTGTLKQDTAKTAQSAPYQPSDPAQLEKDIKAEKTKVFFEGMGTEPFWTIYITSTELLWVNEGTDERKVFQLQNTFNSKLQKQTIRYIKPGNVVDSMIITHEESSLGMGPDMYPYGIVAGPLLDGGGDTLFIKDFKKYERDVN